MGQHLRRLAARSLEIVVPVTMYYRPLARGCILPPAASVSGAPTGRRVRRDGEQARPVAAAYGRNRPGSLLGFILAVAIGIPLGWLIVYPAC